MSNVGKPHPKDKFTPSEDEKLRLLVNVLGVSNWKKVSEYMVTRTARQCRDRYKNYLAPHLNNSPWIKVDDDKLLNLVETMGKKWSLIAKEFPGRTDINIKSRYALLMRQEERDRHKHESEPEFLHENAQQSFESQSIIEDFTQQPIVDDGIDSFDYMSFPFDFDI
ncbi:Myb-like DNA-binding domain containing protein [Trichomonas vaginalis G3]|uniref:Myb-like DNA-binding domain containing protein n=1 Tax=Trichomonas vaginalis (strain ATCC PRA-98 / G3) TaxID=412133 RepID=A2DAS2_TRIV3|nr:RNA polymerase II transcription regulator recruiting protein [Trichomonas vaginalis G3]EAY22575.1 Myb-like DNA-binding domain containing protein [Trichomonas vaginalis G3]KAI5497307.1 RNA polymerase II transcription regulator recruiting protein [Trichomonas vaginalis G3]|eukprot:XP_001583561.1 Myb-like DNA-binding domain containing protein [Trichomonas vaginalis G3]